MSIVILAEKPSQAKAYAEAFQYTKFKNGYIEVKDDRFFNDKTYITWGYGHLAELVKPEVYKKEWKKWTLETLPISPKNFKYSVGKDKQKQFNIVKKLLQNANKIIIATDCDREGENIARTIIQLSGSSHKPTKRLWINSLEVDEIQKGFKNLEDGERYYSLFIEAQTRQFSDWLVGINASRLYTLLLQQHGIQDVFSVGRVQSPTLYLIYKRNVEIKNFKSKPFYEIVADTKVKKGEFEAKYKGRFDNRNEVVKMLSKYNISNDENYLGTIKKVDKKIKKQSSPKLHSLSTLQAVANKKWKYSPSDVLNTVQDLYEKKLLTYPRTDTNYITENEFLYIKEKLHEYKKVLDIEFDVKYSNARKRYVNNSKVQEHYAIIPTKQIADLKELSDKEKNIYLEVLNTTLAMFADDYIYEETMVEVDVNGMILHAKGVIEKNKGWKALFNSDDKNDKKLPILNKGEQCDVVIKLNKGVTKPPKPYTEGGLIQIMKNAGKEVGDEEAKETLKRTEGIGTEATRASIIETLKQQKYIEVKKNIVHITKKGEILCKVLEGTLLASPEMTAKWEEYLYKIGKNQGSQHTFLDTIERFILSLLEDAPKRIEDIKDQLVEVQEQSYIGKCLACAEGNMVDKGNFYGCSNYKNGCKFTLPKVFLGKTLSKTHIQALLSGKRTNLIKGFKGKKGKFDAYLKVNMTDRKLEFEFPERKITK